jgi:hypothetical protein
MGITQWHGNYNSYVSSYVSNFETLMRRMGITQWHGNYNSCNKYDQIELLSVSDWPIIMIRPGGFLLGFSPRTYLLSWFEFYGWGCKRVQN